MIQSALPIDAAALAGRGGCGLKAPGCKLYAKVEADPRSSVVSASPPRRGAYTRPARLEQMKVALDGVSPRPIKERRKESCNPTPLKLPNWIKSRIEGGHASADIRNQGTVVRRTDGIVRIHGLSDVMQGEMLEFPGHRRVCPPSVWRSTPSAIPSARWILGEYEHISGRRHRQRTGRILKCPSALSSSAAWVNALVSSIDGKGPITR